MGMKRYFEGVRYFFERMKIGCVVLWNEILFCGEE